MPVRLNGSTSGYVELKAPAVAGTTSLELPTDSIKPGLVLVNETTFSAVSSVSVNNCFSSLYDFYVIKFFLSAFSATDGYVYLRLRASGTDDSSNTYWYQRNIASRTSISGSITTATFLMAGYASSAYPTFTWSEIQLRNPNISGTKSGRMNLSYTVSDGTPYCESNSCWLQQSSAFDGFSLFPQTGTMTGTVRVYGYRNSL